MLCWPEAPLWPDAAEAGDAVAGVTIAWLTRTGATRVFADGALPVPGVYGVPEQWPHIREILARAGFARGSRTEVVLLADVARLAWPAAPVAGLAVRRTLGVAGTRLSALLDREVVGYIEVEERAGELGRVARQDGWADIGNLCVAVPYRRRGIGRWLLGHAAAWLRLAHVDRLLGYAEPDHEEIGFLRHVGFVDLTTTSRGWELTSRRVH